MNTTGITMKVRQSECASCGSVDMIMINAAIGDDCMVARQCPGVVVGYLPDDIGLGSNGRLGLMYCGNCGKIHGKWPLTNQLTPTQPEVVQDTCSVAELIASLRDLFSPEASIVARKQKTRNGMRLIQRLYAILDNQRFSELLSEALVCHAGMTNRKAECEELTYAFDYIDEVYGHMLIAKFY